MSVCPETKCIDSQASIAAFKYWKMALKYRSTGAVPPFPTRNNLSLIASGEDYPPTLRAQAFELYASMTNKLLRSQL